MRLHFAGNDDLTPVGWLAPGLIPRRGLTVISGLPGSGKSALALNLIAGTGAWIGLPVDRRPALWLAYEAARSTLSRLAMTEGSERSRVVLASDPPSLMLPATLNQILGAIDTVERELSARVETLVVDAFAAAMRGYDENSGRDVGRAMDVLLKLAASRDLAVVLLTHRGKGSDAGTRGHSSITADASAALAIVGEGQRRRLRTIKQRDAEPADDIPFRIVERGGSLVVEGGQGSRSTLSGISGDARTMLDVILSLGGAADFDVVRARCAELYASGHRGAPREGSALRMAISRARKALSSGGLIVDDGVRVTVTERHEASPMQHP